MLGEGAWLPISYRTLREVMGSSCGSSIQQPQTASKTWLGFYAHCPCFFTPATADDLNSWGSLPEAQCPLPLPLSQEQTKLFGRGLALHCHYTLAMLQRIHLARVKFLVAFHFHVCEKPIHSCTQLVFIECLQCTRHWGVSRACHFLSASPWPAGESSVVIHQSQFCLAKEKEPHSL